MPVAFNGLLLVLSPFAVHVVLKVDSQDFLEHDSSGLLSCSRVSWFEVRRTVIRRQADQPRLSEARPGYTVTPKLSAACATHGGAYKSDRPN